MLEAILSVLIVLGAVFVFIGSLGLARLSDFYTRLHGPTKATTLGVGSLLIASLIHFSTQGQGISLHEGLVTLFLFITAPVSAHLLAKAALHLRVRSLAEVPALVGEAEALPAPGVGVSGAPDSPPGVGVSGDPDKAPHAGLAPMAGGPDGMSAYRLGAAAIVGHQLQARFGPLRAHVRQQIALADVNTLLDWSLRLLTAESAAAVLGDAVTMARRDAPD